MRVLHYEPAIRLELGGVVRAVLDIAAEQAKAGANVTLVTHDAKDVPSNFPGTVKIIPGPGILGRLGSGTASARSLCQQNDVIHLHGAWSLANLSGPKSPSNRDVLILSAPTACSTIGAWSKRA